LLSITKEFGFIESGWLFPHATIPQQGRRTVLQGNYRGVAVYGQKKKAS
jgi:hypothetical protein